MLHRLRPLAFVALLVMASIAGCLAPASSTTTSTTPPTSQTSTRGSHPQAPRWWEYPYHYTWKAQDERSSYMMVKFRVFNETKFRISMTQNATYHQARIWYEHGGISMWGRPHLLVSGIYSGGSFTSCPAFKGTTDFLSCPLMDLPGPGGMTGMSTTLKPGTYFIEESMFAANRSGITINAGFEVPIEVLWTDEGATRLLFMSGPGADVPYQPGTDVTQVGSWTMTTPFCANPRYSGGRADEVWIGNDQGVMYDFYSEWTTLTGKKGNDTAPPAWFLRSDPRKWDVGLNVCEAPGNWTFKAHLTDVDGEQPPVAFVAVIDHPRIVNATGVLDAIGPGAFNDTAWPKGSSIPSQNLPES